MKKYIVFFEIYGKKMKTVVCASTPEEAEIMVKKKLTIIKTEVSPDKINMADIWKGFEDALGVKF